MSKGIFITATGTDVGKTYITALITKTLCENGINAGYYKAVLSGAEMINEKIIAGDAKLVFDCAKIEKEPNDYVSYILKTPVSPHLAAELENVTIELNNIYSHFNRIKSEFEYITVEGSGGIICPIRLDGEEIMLTDIIKKLGLEVLIVASSELGTINHTVLTVEYVKQHGICIRGIILNKYDDKSYLHRDNKQVIERLTGIEVIAVVQKGAERLNMQIDKLCSLYKET
ncbi:dethiobiotin synthase [Desulfosporosinus sp. BICA1-9]|uniref:dethiobiotin synthase n=1 Tax=Desulfosporosinus sp. BICA1-9 TaxID=1531958 RepID=UPI00054C7ED3|nr:dethiobiotin synthase [Desulfosporosinus sp. BICA1-9]KJS48293.1 MAG: dethiobiotin synthetase [Peptococcaceae bacterium BRH_c23]KJS90105.1 MAG: dethiobiotin synthetase [Desulfosporosinus sp. BICA1-9]